MTSDERKEWHWLNDMRQAIAKIEEHPKFSGGRKAFDEDEYFRVWVLFHLERIGECAASLRRDHNYDEKHPDVDWKGTQGMRRKIVHTYWDTDHAKVWQAVEYLPKITAKLDLLLKEKPQEPPESHSIQRQKLSDMIRARKEQKEREDNNT